RILADWLLLFLLRALGTSGSFVVAPFALSFARFVWSIGTGHWARGRRCFTFHVGRRTPHTQMNAHEACGLRLPLDVSIELSIERSSVALVISVKLPVAFYKISTD